MFLRGRMEGSLWELVLLSYPVSSRGLPPVVRLGGKHLHLLSLLAEPWNSLRLLSLEKLENSFLYGWPPR